MAIDHILDREPLPCIGTRGLGSRGELLIMIEHIRNCCRQLIRASRGNTNPITTELLANAAHVARNDRRSTKHRSEEHTSELQSHVNLVCRLLLEKKNN